MAFRPKTLNQVMILDRNLGACDFLGCLILKSVEYKQLGTKYHQSLGTKPRNNVKK